MHLQNKSCPFNPARSPTIGDSHAPCIEFFTAIFAGKESPSKCHRPKKPSDDILRSFFLFFRGCKYISRSINSSSIYSWRKSGFVTQGDNTANKRPSPSVHAIVPSKLLLVTPKPRVFHVVTRARTPRVVSIKLRLPIPLSTPFPPYVRVGASWSRFHQRTHAVVVRTILEQT